MGPMLSFLFWYLEAAYCIHCLDESLSGGGFVAMVRRRIWAGYSARRFVGFNAGLHALNVAAILLFETFGGRWIVAPLAMAWMFATNGLWHAIATLGWREYSPGLTNSPLYWIGLYLLIRYGVVTGAVGLPEFALGGLCWAPA